MSFRRLFASVVVAVLALPLSARAGETTAAVATNFARPMSALTRAFEGQSAHHVTVVLGSTGKLYAQILNGAPFDLLLAADAARPARLAEDGLGEARFTYAIGQLVLWSADPERIDRDGVATLRADAFRHLAVANPELAPYGAAAREVLINLDVFEALSSKLVRGENIGQAFQLVATGNAELGFVAGAQVLEWEHAGSAWSVPPDLHTPIRQDAILLTRAADNEAARAFLDFLRSPKSRALIERFGYGVEAG